MIKVKNTEENRKIIKDAYVVSIPEDLDTSEQLIFTFSDINHGMFNWMKDIYNNFNKCYPLLELVIDKDTFYNLKNIVLKNDKSLMDKCKFYLMSKFRNDANDKNETMQVRQIEFDYELIQQLVILLLDSILQ